MTIEQLRDIAIAARGCYTGHVAEQRTRHVA